MVTSRRDLKRKRSRQRFLLFVVGVWMMAGCGYHVAGKATKLPASLKIVAVPTFTNNTTVYKVEQRLTRAVINELISRTHYKVTSSEHGADAIVSGTISNIFATPVIFSPSGRASTFLINVTLSVAMTDPSKKTTYYQNNNFTFREEYEISRDPGQFFQEDSAALDRLSRQFARTLVSAILENF